VRTRAANSNVPGSGATYNVGLYGALSQTQARAAVRMERKLELGMEGHAFFDFARWGVSLAEINGYTTYEKKWRAIL